MSGGMQAPVLRLKVTGRCNRGCCFCHEEGGMSGVSDMPANDSVATAVGMLSNGLGISAASITGGEPLLHGDLPGLMRAMRDVAGLASFSLTTNGTIPYGYERWGQLCDLGLRRVNVSISDLLEYSECGDGGRWPELPVDSARTVFGSQLWNMRVLNKVGIEVDVNVVVFNDYQNTKNVFQKLRALRSERVSFRIMLLPNLSSRAEYECSLGVIDRLLHEGGYRVVAARKKALSSGGAIAYEASGETVYVKSTMLDQHTGRRASVPFTLDSMCGECPLLRAGRCLEGFYGLRVEVRGQIPWVRACLHRADPAVLVPLEEFIGSQVFAELRSLGC